jgi:signal transduction histidine kinase
MFMRIICTFYELFYSRKVELHKKYSDSVFNEKKENQINYQRLKREEVVNKNLAKEHELMQLKLTQKQHQMWAFAGTIFSLIVLAIALFRNNQLKSKLNNKLRKKNQEIEDKNKQLSDLNTTKDILFRVIAHDLKHPMALMVSYTEMMDEDFDDFRGMSCATLSGN